MGTKDEPETFDVAYDSLAARVDFHVCTDWNGTCSDLPRPHGYSFEEARDRTIKYHEDKLAYWRGLTLEQWKEDNGISSV